jgi:hypothetical protein
MVGEAVIGGKFSTKEYKRAKIVSSHIRIILDESIPKNERRVEVDKVKKRIYLRLNPLTDDSYRTHAIAETERHAPELFQAAQSIPKEEYKEKYFSDVWSLGTKQCVVCHNAATFACVHCQTSYCGPECQKQDWQIHQKQCAGSF